MIAVWLWTVAPLAALHLLMGWRSRQLLRLQLLLDLLLAATIGPALVAGGDLSPVRCLAGTPPFTEWRWSDATTDQPTQSDLVRQIQPWMEETRRQLLAGRLPLVSERIGGGLPLLANGQTGAWAPPNLPVWALGAERGTTVMAFWKVELAGLGAFLFLRRRWRLRWPAAAAGATACAGSAYLVAWLVVPMGWVIAVAPWAWWAAAWMLGGRGRVLRVFGTGLLAGWLLGSGLNPETSAIVVGSAILAGLILHPARWRRLLAAVAVAAVVAVGLAWPTLGSVAASSRAAVVRTQRPNLERPAPALRLQAVQQALAPMALGHPGRGDWAGGYPSAAAAVGVGGLALGTVAAGRVRRRHRRLLWAALASLAVAAVLGYRLPPLDALLVRLPPFDHMTLPRFVVLVPWSLAVWAALAAEGAQSGRWLRLPWRLGAAALVAAAAAAGALRGLAAPDLALTALTVAAAALATWLLRRPRLLAPALAAELALYALGINPVAAAADRLPAPPLVERLRELQAERGGRVIGLDGALPPNLAARYGLPDLRAYDPLRPRPFVELMAALGDRDPMLGGPLGSAPPRLCGAWSVRFLVSPPGRQVAGWEPAWSDGSGAIWSNPHCLPEVRVVGRVHPLGNHDGWRLLASEGLEFAREAVVPAGTAAVAAGRAELVSLRAEGERVRAVVSCDGPCLLVAARPWAPGWRATVDGRPAPLVRANLAGLGAVSPAGEHSVELRYNPWRWWPGSCEGGEHIADGP
ncbi:MAG TPA: hypothetical protein PKJ99_09900 [Thermoanaerobaculales bacterium]|nr:hypothetical protein [Thermoanaerobaculales bacterium]HQL29595.1 hypothetical protein [Thermoanaerobaculales bacterium]